MLIDLLYGDTREVKSSYAEATKELLTAAYCGKLDLRRVRRLLKAGADVNSSWCEMTFLSIFVTPHGDLKVPGNFAKAVTLILKSGLRCNLNDPSIREALVGMAKKLRGMESTLPARLKMVETLLGRKPRKDEDADRLFQDCLKSRDVSGVLATLFLDADFAKGLVAASNKSRAWLKKQLPHLGNEWH